MRAVIRSYRRTLQSDRRHLLEDFRLADIARKVVGVGSVGTRAWIVLMLGRDDSDPLFLQAKEAQASVLEEFVGRSERRSHGERVVHGQHLMQASSDIFLGWDQVAGRRRRRARLLRPPTPRLEGRRDRRDHDADHHGHLRPHACAARSPGPTPAPATASPSPRTSAAATRSTERSPSSPRPTPIRTSATTTPSSRPRRTAASPPSAASDPTPTPPQATLDRAARFDRVASQPSGMTLRPRVRPRVRRSVRLASGGGLEGSCERQQSGCRPRATLAASTAAAPAAKCVRLPTRQIRISAWRPTQARGVC